MRGYAGARASRPRFRIGHWLRATKAVAHFDSVLPGFGIIPPDHPTAYIEFPGRSQLDASPSRVVARQQQRHRRRAHWVAEGGRDGVRAQVQDRRATVDLSPEVRMGIAG